MEELELGEFVEPLKQAIEGNVDDYESHNTVNIIYGRCILIKVNF